ncbi:MAG TPA: hypothetical protein VL832_06810 [Puia sp.]|jgi:hypothetical protein|nr:hypothetical protein [Puia sp.]
MNDDSTQTEILMQYLDGELSAEETARLERELKTSLPLQEKLERLRAVKQSVRLFALREQVKGIHQEMAPEYRKPAPVVNIRWVVLRVAASVVGIALLVMLYEYRQLSPSALYREGYRPYIITQSRGMSDSGTLPSAYESGRAQDVIRIFRSLPAPGVRDYFLAGNAYLNTGNATQAIQAFLAMRQKNEQNNTHILEEDAEYYLAMSYLKNGEIAAALPLFDKIHNDQGHPYHDKVGRWWLYKLRRTN